MNTTTSPDRTDALELLERIVKSLSMAERAHLREFEPSPRTRFLPPDSPVEPRSLPLLSDSGFWAFFG